MNHYFKLSALLILLISLFFIFSCKKNDRSTAVVTPDLTSKVTASVSGFVTDENNAAVMGATASFGSLTATSDKYGYFEINNTSVAENGAVVTITKDGYFKGIKIFITSTGKSSFCRIKLIPKIISGTINTSSGGSVLLSNGLKVSLPANAVINATTNAVYTGTINVSSSYIDPTSSDLPNKMPGDLIGINTSGALKSLTSYGMAAIELTGSTGELLQVASGQKATLTMPIPAVELAKAPATIPLWYFDETKGYWKEEGTATKTGNAYVGDVAHFSYWNCDYPFADAVKFDVTLLTSSGAPLANTNVEFFYKDNAQVGDSANYYTNFTGCHGMTDENGYITGNIPANSQLILAVFTDACGGFSFSLNNANYTQNFATINTDISLGNITITTIQSATITGNVVNCNNAAVTNGYIIINVNGINTRATLTNTGAFSVNVVLCDNNISASITAEDIDALQESNPTTLNLASGANNVGTLQACGTSINEFVNYTIDGTNYSLVYPDAVFQGGSSPYGNNAFDFIEAYNSSQTAYAFINFQFDNQNIAVGSQQSLTLFSAFPMSDSSKATSSIKVNITEYGNVGKYISGNFSGTVIGQPSNITSNISCNFRVKRDY